MSFETPVALVVFRRVDTLAEVLDSLREVRPTRIFLIADGPRSTHPGEDAECRAVLDLVDQGIDWPCVIERNVADANMGCDRRIISGLDWVFDHVERAVIIEDDIVAAPSFFPWAEAMLERYADDERVVHISGRNDLCTWGAADCDHLLTRSSCVWGWATWRRAWRTNQLVDSATFQDGVAERLAQLDLDPLLVRFVRLFSAAATEVGSMTWDYLWWMTQVINDRLSVVAQRNLVANRCFGGEANRTKFAESIKGFTPVFDLEITPDGAPSAPDPVFDRYNLMVEMLAAYVRPQMVARLARSRTLQIGALAPTTEPNHHFAPFEDPADTLHLLEHLDANGMGGRMMGELLSTFRQIVGDPT